MAEPSRASPAPVLSERLAYVMAALPLSPDMRVLEIGCGPGALARAVAARLTTGHLLATDRSPRAIAQLERLAAPQIAAGLLSTRCVAVEDLVLLPGEQPFDLAVANRVGALDGRHPHLFDTARRALVAALRPYGRLVVDGQPVALS